jgi:hypothetical protein
MWRLFEPVHTVTYFAAESRAAYESAGLRGFWRGYFAGRAAPIGPVGAAPVIAAFFNFAPAMVARALPAVWQLAPPAATLQARSAGAVTALRRLLQLADDAAVPPGVMAAADLLADAAAELDWAGRPLGGPNAALPVPAEPLARLWHAATVLREHRGDGHVAALVAAGLDGCEALALRVAVDQAAARHPADAAVGPGGAEAGSAGAGSEGVAAGQGSQPDAAAPVWGKEQLLPVRGWTGAQWDSSVAALAARGLVEADGLATDAGTAAYRAVEQATDVAAARPWARLGAARTAELAELLRPIADAAAVVLPVPNPIGLARRTVTGNPAAAAPAGAGPAALGPAAAGSAAAGPAAAESGAGGSG